MRNLIAEIAKTDGCDPRLLHALFKQSVKLLNSKDAWQAREGLEIVVAVAGNPNVNAEDLRTLIADWENMADSHWWYTQKDKNTIAELAKTVMTNPNVSDEDAANMLKAYPEALKTYKTWSTGRTRADKVLGTASWQTLKDCVDVDGNEENIEAVCRSIGEALNGLDENGLVVFFDLSENFEGNFNELLETTKAAVAQHPK